MVRLNKLYRLKYAYIIKIKEMSGMDGLDRTEAAARGDEHDLLGLIARSRASTAWIARTITQRWQRHS